MSLSSVGLEGIRLIRGVLDFRCLEVATEPELSFEWFDRAMDAWSCFSGDLLLFI